MRLVQTLSCQVFATRAVKDVLLGDARIRAEGLCRVKIRAVILLQRLADPCIDRKRLESVKAEKQNAGSDLDPDARKRQKRAQDRFGVRAFKR